MNGIIIISSKIGTPIWSREYVHSFGLVGNSSSGLTSEDHLVENGNSLGIRDGTHGVVGDASSLIGKTQHISEMSLSGLLYALKLNSEMCFKESYGNEESTIHTDQPLVISEESSTFNNRNELLLKNFTFGENVLCFQEEFDSDVFCVGFFKKSFLMTSVMESLGCEDQEVEFGHQITKAICDRFCTLYGKKLAGSVRKSFKGFIPHLCTIYRQVVTDILKQMICDYSCCEFQIEWIYACYDSTSLLTQSNEPLVQAQNVNPTEKSQKAKKKKKTSVAINPHNSCELSYMSRIGPMQWIVTNDSISNHVNHSQIFPLINQALTSYSNSLKILGQLESCSESQMKVRLTKLDTNTSQSNTEYYIFRKSSTIMCFPLRSNIQDHHNNLQHVVQAHLYRLESFLQSAQPDLILSPQKSISNILNL